MSASITERILFNNTLYTDKYLKDTINLTKSITIANSKEADLYNQYINNTYPQHSIDLTNKTTWRYYLHLAGQYHSVDTPITLNSIDNGDSITLNRQTLTLHRITHRELLKFDLLYKELVDHYPEQELYIRSVIATSTPLPISQIVTLEDYSIVAYNDLLVEENEDDIIPHLQHRLNNYKNTKLIPYYTLSDSLFLASQYHVLYTFLFTSLLSLRLKNAKTLRAHSYHVLNYLASQHYLDIPYQYLTKEQSLYLYRNLLYLNNHSGQEETFRTLIDKLYTARNISVINYSYSQSNTLDDNNYMEYRFKQKLLNNANLVYSYQDYTLEDIKAKEYTLAPSNPKELNYNLDKFDHSFKNSLYNELLTKDLEIIVIDNTDTVPYKLTPTIVDYWAYLLKTNQVRYLVTVLDPVSNKELRLSTKDLFKLYTLVLYKANGRELNYFPAYSINRVFKPNPLSMKELLQFFYDKSFYHKALIDKLLHAIPSYSTVITSFQFQQFVSTIYKLNIGIWLMLSNLSDKNDYAQLSKVVDNLVTSDVYEFNDETPSDFLNRIGLNNLYKYTDQSLKDLTFSILNNLYDNQLEFLNKYKYIQMSLTDVFNKFNSYTVQIVSNYIFQSPYLVGPRDLRATVYEDNETKNYFMVSYIPTVDMSYLTRNLNKVHFTPSILHKHIASGNSYLDISLNSTGGASNNTTIPILITKLRVNSVDSSEWVYAQPVNDDLLFLALNT